MKESNSNLKNKFTALVFGLIFISVAGLLALTFFSKAPKTKTFSKNYTNTPDEVWTALTDKNVYFNSKPEIVKHTVYDSIKPTWVEYYSPSDSIKNVTTAIFPKKQWSYKIINEKYEMVNSVQIQLDSIHEGTKVTISEISEYQNVWARTYFSFFNPNTVMDYEFVKLENCLAALKMKQKTQIQL